MSAISAPGENDEWCVGMAKRIDKTGWSIQLNSLCLRRLCASVQWSCVTARIFLNSSTLAWRWGDFRRQRAWCPCQSIDRSDRSIQIRHELANNLCRSDLNCSTLFVQIQSQLFNSNCTNAIWIVQRNLYKSDLDYSTQSMQIRSQLFNSICANPISIIQLNLYKSGLNCSTQSVLIWTE